MAEGSWFCGVYRYRFGFEAFIHLNDSGRYEWATRLVTDAGGEPDCEDSGTYASLPRAEGYRLHTFAHSTADLRYAGSTGFGGEG